MPPIKPRTNRVKTVQHITRLQEPNRDSLGITPALLAPDYVLNQLINRPRSCASPHLYIDTGRPVCQAGTLT
jgi:hypothetical protein